MKIASQISDDRYLRIIRFYAGYANILNSAQFDRWPDFFTENGQFIITSAENVEAGWDLAMVRCESRAMISDRVYALQNASTFEPRRQRRIISNIMASAIENTIHVTADYIVTEARLDQPLAIFSSGRFEDQIIDSDVNLRFTRHNCICDEDLVENSLIFPI